ncbi:Ku protein [Leekyejoonella antrihumi]|uniref:Non-homologous end joining protein Ku n=1 Tax=Leekyejoonella antrihumi TaxID=1660198 RepID=A0A563DX76_9MICO|nr:Ku protein [Leekyejoonella antrihumi]TWP34729.1 Ku protein [Leekyejoonella antrihumi]
MRAIWKGAVSFGLVNVPVRLYSATENHDIQFRQVHRADGGRIRYQRVCSLDGETVSYDDIAKGYETQDGDVVILTDDDLADLPISTNKEIAVDKFVPADQIDELYLGKCYYLEPDKTAVKPYVLLREALESSDRVALVTVSIRTRTTVAVLRVRGEVIALQTLLWPDEVRNPDFSVLEDADQKIKSAEREMARMLVDSMAGDYDPDEYEDDYEKAVQAVVEAKLEGGEVASPAQSEESGAQVVDLLAALQQSVDRAKESRGERSSRGTKKQSGGAKKTG